MRLVSSVILVIPFLLACSSDPLKPEPTDCEQILFGTTVDQQASPGSLKLLTNDPLPSPKAAINTDTRFVVSIEKTHGSLQGAFEEVSIRMISGPANMGGFDFLLGYDASAISFQGATEGEVLTRCEWEYFTYRYGADGICTGECPSGLVRLVGLAETNNGDIHPVSDCEIEGTLANLSFLISNDRTLECQYIPIRFFWGECDDNIISNSSGDSLFVAGSVKEYPGDGANLMDLYPDEILPTYVGPLGCDTSDQDAVIPTIEFINGGIDILCSGPIDPYGDISLDGLSYTIADAVMYSDYFIEGLAALMYVATPNQYGNIPGYDPSIAESDVNANGVILEVADLVYLIRVINGEAYPHIYYKSVASGDLVYLSRYPDGVLSIDAPLRAANLVFKGEVTPVLLAEQMEMKFAFDGDSTHVLVWDLEGDEFSGSFLKTNAPLVRIDASTPEGAPVDVQLLPSELVIEQIDPNPFTDQTTISILVPYESDISIWAYSINPCEIVDSYQQTLWAGKHQIILDGSDYLPGEYVLRVAAGGVIKQINMTLIE